MCVWVCVYVREREVLTTFDVKDGFNLPPRKTTPRQSLQRERDWLRDTRRLNYDTCPVAAQKRMCRHLPEAVESEVPPCVGTKGPSTVLGVLHPLL